MLLIICIVSLVPSALLEYLYYNSYSFDLVIYNYYASFFNLLDYDITTLYKLPDGCILIDGDIKYDYAYESPSVISLFFLDI